MFHMYSGYIRNSDWYMGNHLRYNRSDMYVDVSVMAHLFKGFKND